MVGGMDRRLQDLERRWRAEGSPAAGVAYLLAFERAADDAQVLELLERVGVRPWRLVGIGGPVEGLTLPLLREATYRVGPGADADLQLPGVAPGQVALECRQRGLERTCEVTSGDEVRVEGRELGGPRQLADGDLLDVGDARFVVERRSAHAEARFAPPCRGWLTVVAPAERAGERHAVTDALPLARLHDGDDRQLEWSTDERRWVLRRPGRAAVPVRCGEVLTLGTLPARVEARFVCLPPAVCQADAREHVERGLARLGAVETGRALFTRGPDAGRTVVLRRGRTTLAPGLVLEVDLDDGSTTWVARAVEVPPGEGWHAHGAMGRGPDDGPLEPGAVVMRSGARRDLSCPSTTIELRLGTPLQVEVEGHLVVTTGPDAGLRFPLRLGETRIGADPGCDLVLTDRSAGDRSLVVTVRRGWRPVHDPPAWGSRFAWRHADARDDAPLTDGDACTLGATTLVLRACGLGGPPRGWLTVIAGRPAAEAFPVGKFGLDLGELPWGAWGLTEEARAAESVRLQVTSDDQVSLAGRRGDGHVAVQGDPGRADLRDGDVLEVGPTLRLRFEVSAYTRGELPRQEGVRLRALAADDEAPAPAATPPPFEVVRDVDLRAWASGLALSPEGEVVVAAGDLLRCYAPTGEERWRRPGGRATEPWQPRPASPAFTSDGRLLVAFTDGALEVLDRADGRTLEQVRPAKEAMVYLSADLVASPVEPLALVVGPRDASSFEGSRDLRVVAWDLASKQVRWMRELTVGRKYPRPLVPRSGGVFYWHVDRCRPGGFEFIDSVVSRGATTDGVTEALASPAGRPISALADLDAEHLLVVAGGRLARWQRAAPHGLDPFAADGDDSRRGPLAVSPDGRFAACAGERVLELWHVGARRLLHTAPLPGDRVLGLALRDDGQAFVLTSPSRLRVVAFDLGLEPPRSPAPEPEPPPRSEPKPTRPESTLDKLGTWVKGLFFEEG